MVENLLSSKPNFVHLSLHFYLPSLTVNSLIGKSAHIELISN